MANNFELAKKYLGKLDAVYKLGSLTSMLDAPSDTISFTGANEVKIYKTTMDGLANYSRTNGYVAGNITGSWETLKLTQDRGITFSIDVMDQDETMDMADTAISGGAATALDRAFGRTGGEFMRTHVVPEVDAYRFSKYASATGVQSVSKTITASADIVKAIDDAETALTDAEVPEAGRILFITPGMYALLKTNGAAVGRSASMTDRALNRDFDIFDSMKVIKVPQNRFYSAITLNTGSESTPKFGFEKASGAVNLNFMIIHPSAIIQVIKHASLKIFTPAENQTMDAYKFDYRMYHDALVYDNKAKGIYVHKAAASAG